MKTIGPLKLVMARPISAPYSNCHLRIDSGEPSNPDRLAMTTSGRLPLVALIARAVLREACGKRVPEVHAGGPSAGTNPLRGSDRDDKPSMQTGMPPTVTSQTMEFSPSCQCIQRSSGWQSVSETERMTERMSNGCLRSGLVAKSNTSATVVKRVPGTCSWTDSRTSRSRGSLVSWRRGKRSPGTT